MARSKEIGVDSAPARQCAFCEEPFDGPEFWSFMLQKNSRSLTCIRCENESFFVQPDKNSTFGMIALISAMLISLLPLILGLAWVVAFYLGYIDTLWLWAPIGAALLTAALIRFALKIYRWHFYKVQDSIFELKMDFSS